MSTSSSSIFSGSSRYSSDLQAVIDRSVAIASLSLNQLNKDKTALDDQSKALTSLSDTFDSLQTAIDQVGTALGGSSYTASASDDSVLTASVSTGALEGVYKVEVKDAGAYAASMTPSAWAGGTSPSSYTLKVGPEEFTISASSNQASAVAAAINAKAGSTVRATVVNVGGAVLPDYRISLQATKLGTATPQLLDSGGANLQTEQSKGQLATYVVNNSGVDVTSDSRSVSIATGVTVNLKAASDTPVEISVTRSSAAVSDALSAFATAYNNTLKAVDGQRGQSDGALNGQSLLLDLSQSLRGVVTYSDSQSSVGGLDSLGLELQKDGTLKFNQLVFFGADLSNSAGVLSFLGSASSGGFLKAASAAINGIQASSTGLLSIAQDSISRQTTEVADSITTQQTRVDELTERLQAQMAAADALISAMEQQYTQISSIFESMKTASDQYK
jgi:flagellar hook-associated protein 2